MDEQPYRASQGAAAGVPEPDNVCVVTSRGRARKRTIIMAGAAIVSIAAACTSMTAVSVAAGVLAAWLFIGHCSGLLSIARRVTFTPSGCDVYLAGGRRVSLPWSALSYMAVLSDGRREVQIGTRSGRTYVAALSSADTERIIAWMRERQSDPDVGRLYLGTPVVVCDGRDSSWVYSALLVSVAVGIAAAPVLAGNVFVGIVGGLVAVSAALVGNILLWRLATDMALYETGCVMRQGFRERTRVLPWDAITCARVSARGFLTLHVSESRAVRVAEANAENLRLAAELVARKIRRRKA